MSHRQRIASYALIIVKGHILLTKHGRGPNIGKWGLPGGGVEYGEHPENSLSREIFEETNLKIKTFKLDDVISAIVGPDARDLVQEDIHNVGIVYKSKIAKLLPVKEDADGISSLGAKWFLLKHIKPKLVSKTLYEFLIKKGLVKKA